MQDIRQCCQYMFQRRFSMFELRNEIQELQKWKTDTTVQWTDAEKQCIQSFISDKTSRLEFQLQKIREDMTCCSVISKVFVKTTTNQPVTPTTDDNH